MSWNHRVVKHKTGSYTWYAIHEAFYNDDGEIYAITEEPVGVIGENLESIHQKLEWMLDALKMTVLVDGKIKFAKSDQ